MKYLKYFLILLFIPFIVLAETKNVEIKSIELVEKSDNVEELEKATYKDLKLNFNLKFKSLNDFAKYKVIVKNNTDKDYEIDNSDSFNDAKFIKYEFIVDNNIKILKANEELPIYVNISYIKEIDSSSFVKGKYSERNNVALELSNDKDELTPKDIMKFVVNPDTSTGFIIILILLVILSILLFIFTKNKNIKKYVPMLLLILIPLSVYALEKIRLEVETYVEIDNTNTLEIVFDCGDDTFYHDPLLIDYEPGITFLKIREDGYLNDVEDKFKNLLDNTYDYYEGDTLHEDVISSLAYSEGNGLAVCRANIKWPDEGSPNYDEEMSLAWQEYDNCLPNYPYLPVPLNGVIHNNTEGIYISHMFCSPG